MIQQAADGLSDALFISEKKGFESHTEHALENSVQVLEGII